MDSKDIHVVTGASGRTGFPLCLELIKRGKRVRALYREDGEAAGRLRAAGCEMTRCDITDLSTVEAAFEDGTYVYHLAGIVSIESKLSKALERVNIAGTQNVIDACIKQKVKRLIYTGSVHMLQTPDKTSVISEPMRFDPSKVHGGYAKCKAAAGNLVLDAKNRGLEVVMALPSGIIGPYEYTKSYFGEMIGRVATKKLRCYIKGKYDFVDARDIASALCDLAYKGQNGECYIVSGNTVTVKEMMDIVTKAAGVKPVKTIVPYFLAKLFAGAAERYALRKKRKPVFTAYSVKVVRDNCNFSHGKLTALTGYSPRSAEVSLRDQTEFILKRLTSKLKRRTKRRLLKV
jgi:dihydroflavonol-4-reductase